jgi:hypothetical protein
MCVFCVLSRGDEGVSPSHLTNNLGGVTPGVRGRTHDTWHASGLQLNVPQTQGIMH